MTEKPQSTRRTATGTVQMSIAYVVMIACGLTIHVYVARALEPELYGVLAVVTSVIVWWQLVGYSLIGIATVRFVADAGDKWRGVAGTAVHIQVLWSMLVALACAATSPLVARLLGDPSLTAYLRLFSADLVLYGCYEVFRRVLMGRRKYAGTANTFAWYWMAKALLVCGLVALGLSVKGAIIGSMAASLAGLVVAWWYSGVGLPRVGFPARTLIGFGLPLIGIAVLRQLIENMDLWCVKALLNSAEAPGYYGAAKYMYQAAIIIPLGGVASAMFPTLTKAISQNNEESCRELIEQSFRFVFVTMLAALALVGCCAKDVVILVFSAPYAAAATPAVVLMAAALMFSLRGIGGATLLAAGKPALPLVALAPLLPANIALNVVLVPRYELLGAALATALTGLIAASVMLVLVWREFHILFSTVCLLRCIGAAVVVYFLGVVVPGEGWVVLVKLLGLSAVYLLLLILSGELTRRDFEPLIFWRG